MNVLIVDDHLTNLKLLRTQLEFEGQTVFEAHDGVEALALLNRQRVDAVISDILMPRMDGYRLCHEIRKDARFRNLLIIIYTSTYTAPDDKKLALGMGANRYLTKPSSIETIIAALQEVIATPDAALCLEGVQEIEVLKQYNERLVSKLKEKNAKLEDAAVKFRALVEQSIAGIYIIQDDQFVYVNPRMTEILGRSEEEITSRTLYDFIVPEGHALVRENLRKLISGEVPGIRYYLRMLHQSGAVLHGEVHGSRAEHIGRPAVMGTLLDITERKRAEEHLERLYQKYELILCTAAEGILGLDLQGKHTFVNPAAARMLGYGVEELLGRPSHITWHHTKPDGSPYPEKECKIYAAYRNGAVHRLSNEVFWSKNGASFPVEYVSTPIYEQGRVAGAVLTFADITERKRAEEELRQSEERYRAMVQGLPEVVMRFDREGRHLFVSDNVVGVVDLPTAQYIGKTHHELGFPEAQCRFWEEAIRRVFESGSSSETEFTLEGRQGPVIFTWRLLPERDEQGIVRSVLSLMRDISDGKRAEAEKEKLQTQLQQAMKMEAVGRLAGGVAHDFNNLLTVITGYSELLLQKIGKESPMHGELEQIQRAAERAATLTRQLLAFSRKQIIEPIVLDLNLLMADLGKMLVRLIGENIDLKTVYGKDLGRVKVDPGQFEQVLVNLSVNARDAMPDGGTLLIETANVDLDEEYCAQRPYHIQPGRYVRLAVSDTGCGMAGETSKKIFEPFFTTKQKGKGTGLGLSMIFGTVKQSGGSIEVYSEVGKGTTFKIYLPRVEGEAVRPEKDARPAVLPGGTETVLVVEDDDTLRNLCVRILERLGYKALQARDGAEAIATAQGYGDRIDLLLTDVVMPGMNGSELATQLVPRHPEMKVLFTSGYTDDAIVRHGVLDEGVSFIGKPYTPSALGRKVREVLDKAGR